MYVCLVLCRVPAACLFGAATCHTLHPRSLMLSRAVNMDAAIEEGDQEDRVDCCGISDTTHV